MALKKIGLVAASAICSINLWTGAPLFAVWVGSKVQGNLNNLSMTAVFSAIVVLAALAFLLARRGHPEQPEPDGGPLGDRRARRARLPARLGAHLDQCQVRRPHRASPRGSPHLALAAQHARRARGGRAAQ